MARAVLVGSAHATAEAIQAALARSSEPAGCTQVSVAAGLHTISGPEASVEAARSIDAWLRLEDFAPAAKHE